MSNNNSNNPTNTTPINKRKTEDSDLESSEDDTNKKLKPSYAVFLVDENDYEIRSVNSGNNPNQVYFILKPDQEFKVVFRALGVPAVNGFNKRHYVEFIVDEKHKFISRFQAEDCKVVFPGAIILSESGESHRVPFKSVGTTQSNLDDNNNTNKNSATGVVLVNIYENIEKAETCTELSSESKQALLNEANSLINTTNKQFVLPSSRKFTEFAGVAAGLDFEKKSKIEVSYITKWNPGQPTRQIVVFYDTLERLVLRGIVSPDDPRYKDLFDNDEEAEEERSVDETNPLNTIAALAKEQRVSVRALRKFLKPVPIVNKELEDKNLADLTGNEVVWSKIDQPNNNNSSSNNTAQIESIED